MKAFERLILATAALVLICGTAAAEPINWGQHPKWQAVLEQSAADQSWLTELEGTIEAINRRINLVPYVPDPDDDWLAPATFMRTGGDCEDYAIAKYMALRATGVPASRMRIMVGWLPGRGHAVLLLDDKYVLNNLTDAIIPLGRYKRFMPAYGINETDLAIYLWEPHPETGEYQRRAAIPQ